MTVRLFTESVGYARMSVCVALRSLPWKPHWPSWRRWGGLIGMRRARLRSQLGSPPFGWRYVRDLDTDMVLVMPRWLYPVWHLWTYRGDWPYRLLKRARLWRVPEEGGFWREGHFTWPWRWTP